MSAVDAASARSSPAPRACSDCDATASVTSDLHKYQVACNCKQYTRPEEPAPAGRDTPPALPPRPQHVLTTKRRNNTTLPTSGEVTRRRKYAWWCVGCGALSAALGGLLAAAHILLRAYTASPHHLETVPAAVPAAMLVLTGVCIMSLARRRNRYSYMIKVVGACCLVCALTCVLVTITTTVIHMNKLQNLKFCEYTKLTRTCTCFSTPDSQHASQEDEGVRCVFEGVSDCAVVHGALYWCLRGVFALSVTAVLVCIFSSMLAYQLLSHERKKMYWEQLELRCRSLYRPPSAQAAAAAAAPPQHQTNCSCCAQCHINEPAWDISLQHRFWAPGRMGNLYSPNPGTTRKTSAWSWFPWPRNTAQNSRCRMGGVPQSGDSAYGFCDADNPQSQQRPANQNAPYEDAAYPNGNAFNQNAYRSQNFPQSGQNVPQGINFGQSASNFAQNQAGFAQEAGFGESSGTFNAQTGVWGPPPPYSPQARNGSRHHLHQDPTSASFLHHHHIDIHRNSMPVHHDPNLGSNMAIQSHTCRNSSYIGHMMHPNIPEMAHMDPSMARVVNPDMVRLNPEMVRLNPEMARLNPEMARLNPEMARLNPEMARLNPALYPADVNEMARLQEMSRLGNESGRFNTLRGHLVQYPDCQRQLNISMDNIHRDCRMQDDNITIECLHQKNGSKVSDHSSSDSCKKQGKENLAFQNDKHSPIRSSMQDCQRGGSTSNQNAESEVYFADVSSCCNVSLKAECCINANMSALVGTIENHPESTSESDTGSFTLTRQQRPQPQAVGSRRRPRAIQDPEKHLKNQGKLRAEMSRMNEAIDNPVRMNERIEAERMSEMSPKIRQIRQPVKASHPRQSSSDSNVSKTPEFFAPPPPNRSPLSPNTEESLMSDEDDRSIDYLKKNDKPESSKCLAPDCQYEAPREQKEELKTNHLHCYSDTNTMDSGWQSGSEKHITD